jgi:hypothetical protein
MTGPDASREAKGSGWARVDPKIFAQRRQGGIVHMTRTKFTRNINGFRLSPGNRDNSLVGASRAHYNTKITYEASNRVRVPCLALHWTRWR